MRLLPPSRCRVIGSRGTCRVAVSVLGAAALVAGWTAAATSASAATTLFVATNGNDANPGTQAAPLATIQRAVALAVPGTTITIRGGTYRLTTNVQVRTSGTAAAPITMTAFAGEHPVIDGDLLPASHTPVGGSIPATQRGAIHQEASFWRYVGLEITRGPYAIYCNNCNNTVFERLVTRDNYESGLQLQGSSSNNLVLNLDSFGNHDPRKNGESADGLAIKQGSGTGNVVRGARLWNNVDDGFDAFEFLSPITIENTVAWGNGVNRWNFPDFAGDGNGFKLGGGDPDPPANHVVRNSIAFDNTAHGFTDNGNPGALRLDHDTAYRNTRTGFDVDSSHSTLTSNLAVGNATAVALGSSTATGNSWNVQSSWGDADLTSISPSVITGPRTADGSIATSTFLRPRTHPELGARI
jgi:Right handed beta helix region/Protein of unknown function (DUF1565)